MVIESPQEDRSALIWIGIFVLFSAILLTGHIKNGELFDFSSRDIRTLPVEMAKPAESLSNNSVPVPVLPAVEKKYIQITGLQINETDEYMELQFQLEKRAQIFLKLRTGHKYVFHVKNAQSGIESPQLGNNPWLDNISLYNVTDGLEIQFQTHQGVLVETDNRQQQQQNFWSIKLKKLLTSATDKAKVIKLEKVQESGQKKPLTVEARQVTAGQQRKSSPIKLKIKSTPQKTIELQQFNEAVSALKLHQWSKAEQKFKYLLGGKYDRHARLHLLQIFKQQQEKIQLEKLILESQKLYPNDSAFNIFHANELFVNKRYLDLIKLYGHKANSINIFNLLAASYQRTNQHDRAVQHFMQAIEKDPQQSKLWISLGISQQQLGQKSAALKSYQTALASGLNNERLKLFLQQRIRQLSEN